MNERQPPDAPCDIVEGQLDVDDHRRSGRAVVLIFASVLIVVAVAMYLVARSMSDHGPSDTSSEIEGQFRGAGTGE